MAKRTSTTKASLQSVASQIHQILAPPLYPGESVDEYNTLLDRIRSAVQPVDAVEEIWAHDIAVSTWDAWRLRRLRAKIVCAAHSSRTYNLIEQLIDSDPPQESEEDEVDRTDAQQAPEGVSLSAGDDAHRDNLAQGDIADDDEEGADEYEDEDEEDGEEGEEDLFYDDEEESPEEKARRLNAKKLHSRWSRHEPGAEAEVTELLATGGFAWGDVSVYALKSKLEEVEKIDGMISRHDKRRDLVLREIDRRRESFARRMRDVLGEVEDAEFEDIRASNHSARKVSTGPAQPAMAKAESVDDE